MNRALRTAFLVSTLTACGGAGAFEFSETWFFGDSLTDSGAFVGRPDAGNGGRFTTNPGPVWSEVFAPRVGGAAVANNPDNPLTDPQGTNYAQGGARVTDPRGVGQTPSPQNARPIEQQLGFYFGRTGGAADPDALYTLWGGANDLFFNMGLVGAGAITPGQAGANLQTNAGELMGLAARLRNAGARYLMVPLLPDVGAVPAWVLETVQRAGAGNPNQSAAVLAAARVLALGGADPERVRLAALAAGEAVLGLPPGSLAPAYQATAALATALSQGYNAALLAATAGSGAIVLDTWALFQEISADPGAFGLLNVTGTACTTPSSLFCTTATLVDPNAPQLFLYADGVHPTTAGHRIFADYAYSVVTAPALVAVLPEMALAGLRDHQDLLLSRLDAGVGPGWTLILDGALGRRSVAGDQLWDADAEQARLLLGAARRLDEGWVVGGALEVARSTADFAHDMGEFQLNTFDLSLFADYRKGAWFASLVGTVALSADFDDVTRVVRLGGGVREESGDTSADSWGVRARAGYRLWQTGGWAWGPYGGLEYLSAEVDGYREAGARSTAMNFGDQSRDAWWLSAGLFADYEHGDTRFHGALAYEAELNGDDRSLSAGLNSLPGARFHLYDIQGPDRYWRLELALAHRVASGVVLGLGYRGLFGEDGAGGQQIDLGMNLEF